MAGRPTVRTSIDEKLLDSHKTLVDKNIFDMYVIFYSSINLFPYPSKPVLTMEEKRVDSNL